MFSEVRAPGVPFGLGVVPTGDARSFRLETFEEEDRTVVVRVGETVSVG